MGPKADRGAKGAPSSRLANRPCRCVPPVLCPLSLPCFGSVQTRFPADPVLFLFPLPASQKTSAGTGACFPAGQKPAFPCPDSCHPVCLRTGYPVYAFFRSCRSLSFPIIPETFRNGEKEEVETSLAFGWTVFPPEQSGTLKKMPVLFTSFLSNRFLGRIPKENPSFLFFSRFIVLTG